MFEIDAVVYLDGEEECTYMGMVGRFHCLRDRKFGLIYQTDDDDRIHDDPRYEEE